MHNFVFFGNTDLTAIVTELFVAFFVCLVIYLRREDRREGYPLEDELSGRLEPSGGLFFWAKPKTFNVTGVDGGITKPDGIRDPAITHARRTSRAAGSPIEPVGDPFASGVGPNSIAQRADRPDHSFHGEPKMGPMRALPGFYIDKASADPRGMTVVGVDGVAGGVVSDVWIDRVEYMIRYLEVELAGSGRKTLLPMVMANVDRGRRQVRVHAVRGSQFAGAPSIANSDVVTFLEEERIVAYFGAGYLYATPARSEPYL